MRAIAVTAGVSHFCDTITLDEASRHRRRLRLLSDHGIEFLLDLPTAQLLRDGDGLVLEDGRIIAVLAAPEELYEIRGRDGQHLIALAWQIGNRHLPAQIADDRIVIRKDPVIRTMLEGLGADVTDIVAAFNPEPGAYGDRHQAHRHDDD